MLTQDLSEIECALGYNFKNKQILLEALTHRSFSHENPQITQNYNERLEFLGDSVLGLVVVEYLFKTKTDFSEAAMSKIKSYIVKESVLSEAALKISLGRHIRLGKGEKEGKGYEKKSILADAMEAVLGAVYLDNGYESARTVVLKLLNDTLDVAMNSEQFLDFKTDLQNECQMKFNATPEYKIIKQEGKDHQKMFTAEVFINSKTFGKGRGRSKKEAETAAAKEALLKIMPAQQEADL